VQWPYRQTGNILEMYSEGETMPGVLWLVPIEDYKERGSSWLQNKSTVDKKIVGKVMHETLGVT
jgi:hypothetical protein